MSAKSFSNRFPLRKLNRKRDRKRASHRRRLPLPRRAGRGQDGISRRAPKE